MYLVEHFVGDRSYAGRGERLGEIYDQNTGAVQGHVRFANAADVDHVVQVAREAQREWAKVNPQRRARVMFEYKNLLHKHADTLAQTLSREHGKTIPDALGELQRGIELVEFACGIPHLLKGEFTEGAGPGIDIYSSRQPLGVVAGITPFNFPAMVGIWMFGIAVPCGNAIVMKPSEKVPSILNRLAELLVEAGAPPGLINIVHGDKEAVDAILAHPLVKAVSFVGSSNVAHHVYATGAAHGKRVQAMGGAKNHGIILPDAPVEKIAAELIGAAYGSAGERCMALPVVVPVGRDTAERLRAALLDRLATVRVGPSTDGDAQFGPLISKHHFDKVVGMIELGVREGAELVVDGRDFRAQGYENGFLLGPTLFDHVTPAMTSYQEEIFGPVLQIVRADSYEEAAALPSEHQYGNGVAIFTGSGRAARDFARSVDVGMVGINVPLPVPLSYHSFGGWKRSAFGDVNQHGPEGVRFFTKVKTVTQRWPEADDARDSAFVLPTMA